MTKLEFDNLVTQYGISEAIRLTREKLGKAYKNVHIRFDELGQLMIQRVPKRTKTHKPISNWKKEVKRKRRQKRSNHLP